MWNLIFFKDTNEQNRNRLTDIKNKLMVGYQQVNVLGRDKSGVLGEHTHTLTITYG